MKQELSVVFGWVSTFSWSISFYPQIFLNVQNQHLNGVSKSFLLLNFLGFLSYSIYTLAPLSCLIQTQFQNRYHQAFIYHLSDIFFALHALLLTSITIIQWAVYHHKDTEFNMNGIMEQSRFFIIFTGIGVVIPSFLITIPAILPKSIPTFLPSLEALDVVLLISLLKVAITFLKYIPQIHANATRKSTSGWSIHAILLDLIGGIFSLLQVAVDSAGPGGDAVLRASVGKIGLGIVSVCYGIVFIIQELRYGRGQVALEEEVWLLRAESGENFVQETRIVK